MKLITIFILVYFFIKSIYYGIFEIREKENKPSGITVIVLSVIGFIFPIILLILLY